jgi:hypothetical protein
MNQIKTIDTSMLVIASNCLLVFGPIQILITYLKFSDTQKFCFNGTYHSVQNKFN